MAKNDWTDYIPGTIERTIAKDIVFRPLRSWHSGTYAGEGIREVNGDRSGCLRDDNVCSRPLVVTHRAYWNKQTNNRISAFLSYPDGMGYSEGGYFWEIYPVNDDIERFETEEEMERRIIELLGTP